MQSTKNISEIDFWEDDNDTINQKEVSQNEEPESWEDDEEEKQEKKQEEKQEEKPNAWLKRPSFLPPSFLTENIISECELPNQNTEPQDKMPYMEQETIDTIITNLESGKKVFIGSASSYTRQKINETTDKEKLECVKHLELKECLYGARCCFAHNTIELRPPACHYGKYCNNITIINGEIKNRNNSGKICTHIHENETKEQYLIRTGIISKTPLPPPTSPPVPSLSKPVQNSPINCWQTKQVTFPPLQSSQSSEVILKVPKEIAAQAMELAIKIGNKNIKVELV